MSGLRANHQVGEIPEDKDDETTDCVNFVDDNHTVDSFDGNNNNPICEKESTLCPNKKSMFVMGQSTFLTLWRLIDGNQNL